ncbi:hypothetical protein MJD09_07530 [bacterium]|nr:hypothetical protein [bacterium]
MTRRSFCLSHEDAWRLNNIKDFNDDETLSAALRFCISFTYENLCLGNPAEDSDVLLTLTRKNHLLLRYLLVEMIKSHQGQAKPLNNSGRRYLMNLKQEMVESFGKHPWRGERDL